MNIRMITLLTFVVLILAAGCGDGAGSGKTEEYKHIEKSRFGFFRPGGSYPYVADLGVHWQRPHPGPFAWGSIEPEKGTYDWSEADAYVSESQDYKILIDATIWPYADWDQKRCHEMLPEAPIGFMPTLGDYRGKPCDMDAYREFVRSLVDRYDGDGVDDMPGLVLPIKYWEVVNEPDLPTGTPFFTGDPTEADYLEVLQVTGQEIRGSDPDAKVLNGGIAILGDEQQRFWKTVLGESGASLIDVLTIHAVLATPEDNLIRLNALKSGLGLEQPVWVTEIRIARGQDAAGHEERNRGGAESSAANSDAATPTPTELAEQERWSAELVRQFVVAFGEGADKLFYMGLDNATPTLKAARLVSCSQVVGGELEEDHLILSGCVKQKPYYAFGTMVAKLDHFDSAMKIKAGQYLFTVDGSNVYVLWGTQPLPEEIKGTVRVTDIYGGQTEMDAGQVQLTEVPVYVEAPLPAADPSAGAGGGY